MMKAQIQTPDASVRSPLRDQTDQRLDLHKRFLRAGIADPTFFGTIPRGAFLLLLPDGDPDFVVGEIAVGIDALRRGRDVYFRHVRVADLPELPDEPSGPPVGQRRTTFSRDGSVASQEVCGADGAWHPVEPPEPVDDPDHDPPGRSPGPLPASPAEATGGPRGG